MSPKKDIKPVKEVQRFYKVLKRLLFLFVGNILVVKYSELCKNY